MDIATKKKVQTKVYAPVYVKTYGVVNNVMFLVPVKLTKIAMVSVEHHLVKTREYEPGTYHSNHPLYTPI